MTGISLGEIISWLESHNGAITALSTVVIAGFTSALFFVSRRQARLIDDQIRLARDEFHASHPPKLRARRAILAGTPGIFPSSGFGPGQQLNASIHIVNSGGSVATIFWSRYRIYFGKSPYHMVPYRPHPPQSLSDGETWDRGPRADKHRSVPPI